MHPVEPSTLASTSHDYTVRIYDITEKAQCKIDNPRWPGKPYMSLGGPAFGLRANEPEGVDFGRCTAVLSGGQSGGHMHSVLGAVRLLHHPSALVYVLTRSDVLGFS